MRFEGFKTWSRLTIGTKGFVEFRLASTGSLGFRRSALAANQLMIGPIGDLAFLGAIADFATIRTISKLQMRTCVLFHVMTSFTFFH